MRWFLVEFQDSDCARQVTKPVPVTIWVDIENPDDEVVMVSYVDADEDETPVIVQPGYVVEVEDDEVPFVILNVHDNQDETFQTARNLVTGKVIKVRTSHLSDFEASGWFWYFARKPGRKMWRYLDV